MTTADRTVHGLPDLRTAIAAQHDALKVHRDDDIGKGIPCLPLVIATSVVLIVLGALGAAIFALLALTP